MRRVLLTLVVALQFTGTAHADERQDLRYALTRLGADVLSIRCDWASTAIALPCRAHYRYVSRYRRPYARRAHRVTTLWCLSFYDISYDLTPVPLPPGVEQDGPMVVMRETYKRCHLPRTRQFRDGTTSLR